MGPGLTVYVTFVNLRGNHNAICFAADLYILTKMHKTMQKKLTEEEIFHLLTNSSDVEDESDDELDNDRIDLAVEKVRAAETECTQKLARIESESEGEGKDEEGHIIGELELPDLPTIESSVMEDLGVNIDDIVNVIPSEQACEIQITKKKEIKWKTRSCVKNNLEFINTDGVACEEVQSPYSYFRRYLGDDFFDSTANFTNAYAHQKGGSIMNL